MDKPISLSVKDFLVRRMAVKLMLSEKTIDAVISHQFSSANEALLKNKSLEISGFGKFYFNQKKANKKMEKMLSKKRVFEAMLQRPDLTEQKRQSVENKLNNTLRDIDILKPKITSDNVTSECKTDSGGMA